MHPWTRIAAFGAVSLAITQAVNAQAITPELKQRTLERLQQTVSTRAFVPGVDFAKWPAFLEKQKGDLDKATSLPTFTNVVNTALREFGISHIRLFTPKAAEQRRTGTQLGFGFSALPEARGLAISAVVPDSPAAKLGLETGDIITEIEGVKASAIPSAEINETSLLTVLRPSTGKQRYCMILRGQFSTDRSPSLKWVNEETALFKLWSFTRGYDRAVVEKLLTDAAPAKNLIIDLRGNGGGLVSNLNHLLALLCNPDTPVGTNVTRQMAERFASEVGGDAKDLTAVAKWAGPSSKTRLQKVPPFKGRIFVLIDRRSGSASEITSAVLREERGATLIGKPSAGAVLVSIFSPLNDGFELQIPLSDYITPKGRRLEKNPLVPDFEADAPSARVENDPAVDVVLAQLAKPTKPLPAMLAKVKLPAAKKENPKKMFDGVKP